MENGTVVADIGAGDGSYAFSCREIIVGATGKVFATEIDDGKLGAKLRGGAAKRDREMWLWSKAAKRKRICPWRVATRFIRGVFIIILTKLREFDASFDAVVEAGRMTAGDHRFCAAS